MNQNIHGVPSDVGNLLDSYVTHGVNILGFEVPRFLELSLKNCVRFSFVAGCNCCFVIGNRYIGLMFTKSFYFKRKDEIVINY